jgi:hypothetical protein
VALIQLVPFKVKAIKPPNPEDMAKENMVGGVIQTSRLMNETAFAWQKQYMWGREWTVVGLDTSGMFLLIRAGEIAQWYPREYCEVVESDD